MSRLVLLLIVCAIASALPTLKAYEDIDALVAPVEMSADGHFRASVSHQVSPGHIVTLNYDVVHAHTTHSIHHEQGALGGLQHVQCEGVVVVLHFTDASDAMEASAQLALDHRLVGSYACNTSNPTQEVLLMRRIVGITLHAEQITLKTIEIGLEDIFAHANVTFTTSALPSIHHAPLDNTVVVSRTASSEDNGDDEHSGVLHTHSRRGFGHWLSQTWGSTERLALDVAKVVGDLVVDALSLVGGKLNVDYTYSQSLINYNFNSATNRAQNQVNFSASVACTNCYARFDAGLHFGLLISDYKLDTLDVSAFGVAKIGMGSAATITSELHFSLDVGTFSVPRITFVVSGVPITIKFTIPVSLGLDAEASMTSLSNNDMSGTGQLRFGVSWSSGSFRPYSTHTLTFDGVTYMGVSGDAHVTAWVRPIIVMDINLIGGPSFTLRPYAEAFLSLSSCAAPALSITTNAGVQGVVGCTLEIKLVGHDVFKKSMSPVTVLTQMYPISSGCYKVAPLKASAAAQSTQLSPRPASLTETPFLIGSVWHGVQSLVNTSMECENMYPHSVDYSLQLVSLNATQAVFVLAGNAMDLVNNNTEPGYCVFQQLMTGTIDRATKTLSLNDMIDSEDGVNYFSCSSVEFPVKASLQQYVFVDALGLHLRGVHDDQCVTSTLDGAPSK